MSISISSSNILAFVQLHMDKYGEMLKDKMEEADRAAQMMEDISKAQQALSAWRATHSNNDTDGDGKSVQQEACAALEALKEKYPEISAEIDEFLAFGKNYKQGTNPSLCNSLVDGINKRLGDIKDANAKHDQLAMLEINDLHSKYNRVSELANQFLSSNARTLDSIVKNVGG